MNQQDLSNTQLLCQKIRKQALLRFESRLKLDLTWKTQKIQALDHITLLPTTLLINIHAIDEKIWISCAHWDKQFNEKIISLQCRLFHQNNNLSLLKLKYHLQILANRFEQIIFCTNKIIPQLLPKHHNLKHWIMNINNLQKQCLNQFSPDISTSELLQNYLSTKDNTEKAIYAQKIIDATVTEAESLFIAAQNLKPNPYPSLKTIALKNNFTHNQDLADSQTFSKKPQLQYCASSQG